MEIMNIGRITFGGVMHAMDENADPICGTEAPENFMLIDDQTFKPDAISQVSCKRCIRKIETEPESN